MGYGTVNLGYPVKTGKPGGVATLDESGKVPPDQLPEMDYDPAGSADKVQKSLNSHTSNKQNPHGVTAEQVGADPKGSASSAVSTHNQDEGAHPAIQEKLNGVSMAVRATYPVADGQTIKSGDVVDVVNGEIQKTSTPQSKDAIALQSGTAGQSIEVIYSGTVAADWVTDGQSIESDGVYGVGVMDKVLQVWSKDRPGRVSTGSYIGTGGTPSTREIYLGFSPYALILYSLDTDNVVAGWHANNLAIVTRDAPFEATIGTSNEKCTITITDTGFITYSDNWYYNQTGKKWNYIALR